MARDIHNGLDIIDSRDVIKRIEELESELQDAYEGEQDEDNRDAFDVWLKDTAEHDTAVLQDAAVEYIALRALAEEGESSADWPHGETLIRDSYFVQYAQELADDIGAIKSDAGWPNRYIDWEAAAEALQQDYTSVDYDGVTYWIRS